MEQKEVIKSGRKRNNVGAAEDCHGAPFATEENDVRAADRSSKGRRLIAPGPCGELLYAVRANS